MTEMNGCGILQVQSGHMTTPLFCKKKHAQRLQILNTITFPSRIHMQPPHIKKFPDFLLLLQLTTRSNI